MNDDWKGEHHLKGIKRNKGEGAGYNMKTGAMAARQKDALVKKHMPLMIELIQNCKANGYWEETKKQTYAMIIAEMKDNTKEWDQVPDEILKMCLKRIRLDAMHW